jgi:hypothetical protein
VLIRNGDNSLFSPSPLSCQSIVSQLLKSGVAVEKLTHRKIAEKTLR